MKSGDRVRHGERVGTVLEVKAGGSSGIVAWDGDRADPAVRAKGGGRKTEISLSVLLPLVDEPAKETVPADEPAANEKKPRRPFFSTVTATGTSKDK